MVPISKNFSKVCNTLLQIKNVTKQCSIKSESKYIEANFQRYNRSIVHFSVYFFHDYPNLWQFSFFVHTTGAYSYFIIPSIRLYWAQIYRARQALENLPSGNDTIWAYNACISIMQLPKTFNPSLVFEARISVLLLGVQRMHMLGEYFYYDSGGVNI